MRCLRLLLTVSGCIKTCTKCQRPTASTCAETIHIIDGNKRTALACALVFLEINDISIQDPDGLLYQAMVDVASGALDKLGLIEVFRGLG